MRRLRLASLLVVAVVFIGFGAVLAEVSRSADLEAVERETQLVERRVERLLDRTVQDITSASVWNDAVAAFAGPEPNLEWIQVNFGDYYADYMNHAVTLVYDADGRPILASRDSETVDLQSEAAMEAAVAPIAADLRRTGMRYGRNFGLDAAVSRQGLVRVDGRLYVVGAATVAAEDAGAPPLAAPPVVISAMPAEILVESLTHDLGLAAAELNGDGGAYVPLHDFAGAELARLSWTPARPGTAVLRSAAPLLLALLLALAVAGGLMWRRSAGNVRRMIESEAALERALEEAQAASLAKSRFLSNMSHELRTPLNGVLGMAEVMAMGPLADIQKSRLAVLRQAGRSLLGLIESLLDVARLDQRDLELKREPFSPEALAAQAASEVADMASAKGLEIELRLEAPGRWLGDRDQLSKSLRALTRNAVTFTTEGRICVAAREDAVGRLVLEVADTGPGMTAAQVEALSRPFSQADESPTRAVGGAGLGLSISRGLVEAMGGTFEVRSTPGQGSTFILTLPAPRVETALYRQAA